ncbi:hypothetical protein HMF7854_14260 [Sphingomonas ginkgonis]|uniref:Lipoprotein n=1 Tax=Sphingomonas ginkgonis TaxID=2315330 RepID=A0A429VDB7_9SPHN|nr:hypothetical protein [Sphingomonas ginkgonis]RST31871.1 hypothetical protein HMF7854_14260 [Sphingomonas ginkgonis]
MRRLALLLALLLPSCSAKEAAAPKAEQALYAGQGRDRLCLSGERAGLITYGAGDLNCSVSGTASRQGDRLVLVPTGDPACRIEASVAGSTLTLGARSPSCSFYCAPGADWAGKRFIRSPGQPAEARDLAGDPLC